MFLRVRHSQTLPLRMHYSHKLSTETSVCSLLYSYFNSCDRLHRETVMQQLRSS